MTFLKYIILLLGISQLMCAQNQMAIDTSSKKIFTDKYFSTVCIKNIEDNNIDGLKKTIDNWVKISINEPVYRVGLLMDIYNQGFNLNKKDNLIENLLIYKAIQNGFRSNDTVFFLPHEYITGYPNIDTRFDNSTKKYAHSVSKVKTITSQEKQICEFYAGLNDSIFHIIQSDEYENTELNKLYVSYINDVIKDSFSVKFGVVTGMWLPVGNINTLGNHYAAGFQMGGYGKNGWGVVVNLLQRFQNTANPVMLNFNDTIRESNDYSGGCLGIDVSKRIFSTIQSDIEVSLGMGYDSYLSTKEFPELKRYMESYVNSANLNFGLTYRFNFQLVYFIEAQMKYNIINYIVPDGFDLQGNEAKGSDLSGNAFGININFGFFSGGKSRRDKLRYLDYKF